MQYGTQHSPTATSGEMPVSFLTDQPEVTLSDLLHHTGFSIKVRFLLALTLIAILPSILLVLLLGDPTGSERQATTGAALFAQAQSQAQAVNQALSERQKSVMALAHTGLSGRADTLEAVQASDPTALAWLVVDASGFIFTSGDQHQALAARNLTKAGLVSDSSTLLQFVQNTVNTSGTIPVIPAIGYDRGSKQSWIAFAAPLSTSQGRVVLAVFSLPEIVNNLIAQPGDLKASASVLLDQKERVVATAGGLTINQPLAVAPVSFNGVRLNTSEATTVLADPLSGHTDLAVGINIPILNGQYLVLVEHNTLLVASNSSIFTGRNTPLLLLGIFVLVVLVATWIALPIIRPIRRATRVIEATTEDVRKLARDARVIAEDHQMGTTILSGASKRLSGRRLVLIRDTTLIARVCQDALPRLQLVLKKLQEPRDQQAIDELGALYQGFQQIHATASAIADGLGKDVSLDQLDQAMVGAREIARQFEETGRQLEEETEHLETAAKSLI